LSGQFSVARSAYLSYSFGFEVTCAVICLQKTRAHHYMASEYYDDDEDDAEFGGFEV